MIDTGGSSLAAATAFLQRAIRRTMESEVDVRARAVRFLKELKSETKLLKEVAAINVARDWEVLNEESALIPECLELQLRVLELAKEHPIYAKWAEMELSQAPIGKLYKAIVKQASSDGFERARLSYAEWIACDYGKGAEWEDAMEIPGTLGIPMLGFAKRLRATGLEPMKQFAGWDFISSLSVDISASEPKVVTLSWTKPAGEPLQ